MPRSIEHTDRRGATPRWGHIVRSGAALAALLLTVNPLLAGEPVHSKSRRFRIPFQFDIAELRRLGAKDIQLYVSQDRGLHWAVGEAVSPDQSKFTFEAPADGEYWFSVKTRTQGGLEYPAGPHQPGLQVIVDTAPPQITLEISQAEPGRARLTWAISDAALDVTSIKLETLDPAATAWQPVALRAERQGETTWSIAQGGVVQAQATVNDLAGNSSTKKVEVVIAAGAPAPRVLDNSQPIAAQPAADGAGVMANAPPPREMQVRPQVNKPGPMGLNLAPPPVAASPRGAPVLAPLAPPEPNLANLPPLPPADRVMPPAVTPMHPPRPVADNIQHRVNSSVFKIEYEIEGVGSSGVGNVELYISENNGQSWFHYGSDPDRASPVEVSVPTDGQYGFAFRVANGLGLVELPPQPGEHPEVSIVVDRAAPQAKLWPVTATSEEAGQQVLISWTAGDTDLAAQPVTLFYSAQPGGPWETIVSQHENTGRLQWSVPPTLNQKFYVRLEVRDAAGNVTRVDGDQPFLVDRARPKARVKVVESLKNGQR